MYGSERLVVRGWTRSRPERCEADAVRAAGSFRRTRHTLMTCSGGEESLRAHQINVSLSNTLLHSNLDF